MRATGIVRKVDELGRVVLPIELRRTLSISEKDSLEIFTDEDRIILRKYQPGCHFCDSTEHLCEHKGKWICQGCIDSLSPRHKTKGDGGDESQSKKGA